MIERLSSRGVFILDCIAQEERIILEYSQKDREGFTLAQRILVRHDGEKFMEAEVTEAKPLEKLDEGEFKK